MHILVTGAGGMIGRKLTQRSGKDGALHGRAIEKMRSSAFVSTTNSAA
jgi:D-erythronate 2-dehydrogenase